MVALYLSQWLAWIISRHLQHSLPTNTPSLPQGMTAIHTRVSIEYLPTWSILIAAGHVTGPEISASRWLNCVRAILHRIGHRDSATCPVHIAVVLTRRQNIWCYTAQHTTRRGGSHGQSPLSKRLATPMQLPGEDRGGDPPPSTGNERERPDHLS